MNTFKTSMLVFVALNIGACMTLDGDDPGQGCERTLAAFDDASESVCPDNTLQADAKFDQSACDAANDEGAPDNSEFWDCMEEKLAGEADTVCDANGDVVEFEDISGEEGCADLYNG